MTGQEAKTALVTGARVRYKDKAYIMTAIVYRRIEMDSIGAYAELSEEETDDILRDADGERLEIPITEITLITGGKNNGRSNTEAY